MTCQKNINFSRNPKNTKWGMGSKKFTKMKNEQLIRERENSVKAMEVLDFSELNEISGGHVEKEKGGDTGCSGAFNGSCGKAIAGEQ